MSNQTQGRLDAADILFFERQLESVRSKTYDVKYPELKATRLIPVNSSDDPGAETVKYNQYDHFGAAKVVVDYASDFPTIAVKGKEFRSPIKSLGDAYQYSVQEIRAAKMAGTPLEQRKANAAKRKIDELIESIAFSGDANHELPGFNAITNAQSYTIPTGAVSGTAVWGALSGQAPKTGLEILDDLTKAPAKMVNATNGLEVPDTILMPLAQYGYISTKPLQSGSDTTILRAFLASNPWIRNVEGWWKLTGAGAGVTDRMIIYRRDPDALELVLPIPFEQWPAEQSMGVWKVPCHARIGGVVAYYPLSVMYADGI